MRSILDDADYYSDWFTEVASFEFGTFHVVLTRKIDDKDNKRQDVSVKFDNVLFVQAFNEFGRSDDDQYREPHILAKHSQSELVRWVKKYTVLYVTDVDAEEVVHYSILTGDNVYHVLSKTKPVIDEIIQYKGIKRGNKCLSH